MRRLVGLAIAAVVLPLAACGSSEEGADVVAYFADAGDLVEAAQVQVNDVEVGRVTDIKVVRDGSSVVAQVSMDISAEVSVPATDLAAVVRQTSLLGEQFVQLVPGSDEAPYVGSEQVTIPLERTDRRVDVETFLADLSAFIGGGGLEDLNRFTHAQALILENRGRELGETIAQLERFTGTVAGRRADLSAAIDHLASAGGELAANLDTFERFFDSLEDANVLLADQSDELSNLVRAFRRFGVVNARFLARHEDAIDRGFKSLRPILRGLASAQGELRADIRGLRTFFELFARSVGGGPGDRGRGDYIQAEAVLCEVLSQCHATGERGDVPGEGS